MGMDPMQQPLLHRTPDEEFGRRLSSGDVAAAVEGGTAAAEEEEKDCPPVRGLRDAWKVFATESKRLWAIGAPIAFNTICLYLFNSATQVFAGHLGNLELSTVSIALNVISTFTFGFLACLLCFRFAVGEGSAIECETAFEAEPCLIASPLLTWLNFIGWIVGKAVAYAFLRHPIYQHNRYWRKFLNI